MRSFREQGLSLKPMDAIHLNTAQQQSLKSKAIVLFVADRAIRIVDADGELLRKLVLDPTRDYQRQSA